LTRFPDELSARDAKELLDSKKGVCLLDVRQAFEFDLCHVQGSLHVPLDQLTSRIDEIPRGVPVLTLCHHGVRSCQAALYLRQAGFDTVSSVKGGIDAWAKDVDPSIKTY